MGLQLNNMGLSHHLNAIVVNVRELGVIGGSTRACGHTHGHCQGQGHGHGHGGVSKNPGFRREGAAFAVLVIMLVCSFGIIGRRGRGGQHIGRWMGLKSTFYITKLVKKNAK